MSIDPEARPIEILLVEDDDGDVLLTTEALEASKITNNMHVARNGEEALKFLRQEGPYSDAPRPDIVLLDLNLPRVDGREVLSQVKSDEDLRRIPIIVLTTSEAEEDIVRSYDLHANAYVTKPVDFNRFLQVIQSIDEFFVTVVKLPSR
jgi:CheY-like chemotaxis protein